MKHVYLNNDMINRYAKAMTGYCFRNGPIENFHADKCLTDEQMKELNIFMVDRMGYCLRLFNEQRFDDLNTLISYHYLTCKRWHDVDFSVGATELKQIEQLLEEWV